MRTAPAGVLPRGRRPGPCRDEDWARQPLPWRLLRRWRRRRLQRLRRALHDSGDERRQLQAPKPAPLLEQGGLVRPPPTLIWMGLASVLDGPLLMMASFAGTHVVCVPLGSVPCEESKTRPVGACKVPVILSCIYNTCRRIARVAHSILAQSSLSNLTRAWCSAPTGPSPKAASAVTGMPGRDAWSRPGGERPRVR